MLPSVDGKSVSWATINVFQKETTAVTTTVQRFVF
jgi:hypothetical protein